MLNTVSLQGRFTRDPDFKKTITGISVVDFNLAVNQGNKTVYVSCVAWRELAETIARYFKKGQMCVIIGELSSRLITTRDSVDRPQRYTKIEVIVQMINQKSTSQWKIGKNQRQKNRNIGTMMRTTYRFN